MNKYCICLAALALSCNTSKNTASTAQAQPEVDASVTYAATITEAELQEHLYTYASDEFEGRETGEPGQKKAVEYLREAYTGMDIPAAAGTSGTYFQKVPLEMSKLPEGRIVVDDVILTNGGEFLAFSPGTGIYSEVVFVGYGIDEEQYSDYDNVDVNGKVVLTRSGEPRGEDGNYILTGTLEASKWSNVSEAINRRVDAAQAHGAKALIYVDDQNFKRYKGYFDNMRRNNSGRMNLASQEENTQFILLNGDVANTVFGEWSKMEVGSSIATNLSLEIESENQAIDSENVVAILEGSEIPNEYIVISSHLDHIGLEPDGEVNNGADDDGSGTVAMLEIAEAFKEAAKAGIRPKRSIIFLHVTGEEKGLLGSRYYTDVEPLYPLANTVANLNIDMIGRIDPKREGSREYIYLIGSDKLSTELHELSEEVNSKYTGMELDYTYNDENDPNRFYYRSDHYNFAKNNIPIIFYFNGTHVDYHRPGDTPDKINYDLLEQRARLVFHTAWEVANRDTRLVVDKAAK